ncbi:MAG: hypothetical protein GY725_21230 [bacterium]|nr:hypothetical protein [bacterium]
MSSSDFLHRPELVDLHQTTPQPSPRQFTPQCEFEQAQTRPAREIDPEEAHRLGLAEGEQRARDGAMKELAPVIEELQKIALSLANLRHKRLEELEGELTETAIELTRRLIRGELRQDGDSVVRMARACLAEAAEQGVLTLRVAPSDAELLRAHIPELEVDLADASITVQADASVQAGCAVLQTPSRVFDGRPERILDSVVRGLSEKTPASPDAHGPEEDAS